MSSIRLTFCLILFSAFWPAAAWSTETDRLAIVNRAIEYHIRPGFERFSNEAELAQIDMDALCEAPSPAALDIARRRFAALVSAWARIEFLRFGPLADDNRADRIHFWPDRRGIGLRQVQRILGARDESAADPQRLYGRSVAVQGLAALEFVLFGTGAEVQTDPDGDPFRCRYGAAVAANLASISDDLEAAWNDEAGFAATLLSPGEGNKTYRNTDEAVGEILNVLVHGFELIRDIKLQPVLGESVEKAAPKRAIFRRSGQTLAVLAANFQSLQHLFEVSGIVDAVPEKQKWIGGSMLLEFENAQRTFTAIRMPLEKAVADSDQRGKLTYLVILTRSLQRLATEQLAVAMNLAVGFSSLDGD
jgi:predicted lipoprotein